jgi:hypothetical protein
MWLYSWFVGGNSTPSGKLAWEPAQGSFACCGHFRTSVLVRRHFSRGFGEWTASESKQNRCRAMIFAFPKNGLAFYDFLFLIYSFFVDCF